MKASPVMGPKEVSFNKRCTRYSFSAVWSVCPYITHEHNTIMITLVMSLGPGILTPMLMILIPMQGLCGIAPFLQNKAGCVGTNLNVYLWLWQYRCFK